MALGSDEGTWSCEILLSSQSGGGSFTCQGRGTQSPLQPWGSPSRWAGQGGRALGQLLLPAPGPELQDAGCGEEPFPHLLSSRRRFLRNAGEAGGMHGLKIAAMA